MASNPNNIAITQIEGDHEFSLSDDFSTDELRITQSVFYRGDGFVLAIAELNRPNQWDDERFDSICEQIEAALGAQVAA